MSRYLPMIAERALNRPLLLSPAKAETILAVLEGRILPDFYGTDENGVEADASAPPIEASRFVGSYRRTDRQSSVVRASGSSALITIDGSLVNRGGWLNSNSGLVSYEGIGAQVADVANDSEVSSIVFDINSFGGEATGMFALASAIREVRRKKRVVAFINDTAASAAYGIASAADEIVISPTSVVGSIGVVMLHLDRSGEMQMKGIRPTFIHAGAHKVDGNGFGPLSDDVRADLQRDVMTFYDRFLETVAAGRGTRLSIAKARATEARTFIGQQAIDAGLADRFASLGEILAELSRPVPSGTPPSTKEKTKMDGNETTVTADAHKTAVDAARAEGIAQGKKESAIEAMTRIKAILTCEGAKGREAMAQTLALETSMSADEAGKVLASAPCGSPVAATPAIPSIEQRASEGETLGASLEAKPDVAAAAKAGWGKAFSKTNAKSDAA